MLLPCALGHVQRACQSSKTPSRAVHEAREWSTTSCVQQKARSLSPNCKTRDDLKRLPLSHGSTFYGCRSTTLEELALRRRMKRVRGAQHKSQPTTACATFEGPKSSTHKDAYESSGTSTESRTNRKTYTTTTKSSRSTSNRDHSSSHRSSVECEAKSVPVYVMLPLDTVSVRNTLNHTRALNAGLRALKSIGVEGVMVDVWWGIVEGSHPRVYDWSAYMELFQAVKRAGLKMQCVMSFHACGGNVGDHCLVSLPTWVLEVAEQNPDVLFTDREGRRNSEYLSFGVDHLPLFQGRTPLQIYRDFMRSFRDTFRSELGSTIVEVIVGMGPAGELRYPSYPQGDKRWKFPGIGEFQCYDKYTLSCLAACAEAWNHPEWGNGGPHDAGTYKQWPEETGFFRESGSWQTDYGHFFLSWYSNLLCEHAEHVCTISNVVFRNTKVKLSAKIPGVHWWYQTRSHAAELTAGYYNTSERNGYDDVIGTLRVHDFNLNFTCVEMSDCEQPPSAKCSPERLLAQVCRCAADYGVGLSGENALPRFDASAHSQILNHAYGRHKPLQYEDESDKFHFHGHLVDCPTMEAFTFLRMGEALFQLNNWRLYVNFVRRMATHLDELNDTVSEEVKGRELASWSIVDESEAIATSKVRTQKSSSKRGNQPPVVLMNTKELRAELRTVA